MFNGAPPSHPILSSSSSNRRLTSLIALGGFTAVAAATTYWMYNRQSNKKHRNASVPREADALSQIKDEPRMYEPESSDKSVKMQSGDPSSEQSDNVKLLSSQRKEFVGTYEEVDEITAIIADANLEKSAELVCREHKAVQVEENDYKVPPGNAITSNGNNDGGTKSVPVAEFIGEHIPEGEFDWAELVEAEQKEQQRIESKEKQQEGDEEEEQKRRKSEEKKAEPKEEESEVADKMLQQRNVQGRQVYAGRDSTGSTGRQHPVNSICTCSCCVEVLNELQSSRGYKNAESPHSTHSEGSADSGRATGPLNSYSPFAEAAAEFGHSADLLPIYEFEVPNSLVGLIIGIQGKTIKELCTRADVRMLIRPHHTPGKYDTHQICSVEGRRENINKCLHMIRLRFPACRFPDLNLKPVLPPPPTTPSTTTTTSGNTVRGAPSALTLPVGVPCEIYISAHVDAGHFFVQLPTHPSFSSLALLDQYMLSVYTQPGGAPDLPKPCNVGVLCAAPAYNGWFRAITLAYDQEQDEMLVRFVDYGGFARLPRADLRQIRTDFMTLPLQAIECYLANVQPAAGTQHWSDKANELFQQLCVSKIIQASLVGYCKNDGIPCVELHVLDENKKTIKVDQMLLEQGLAKPMDPTLVVRTPLMG